MQPADEPLIFLPGASGNTRLWRPLADRLQHRGARHFVGWPGFGDTPADANITGLADLARMVVATIDTPANLFAQSMGGIIAVQVALQIPKLVARLVLSVTSGGVDVASLGGIDWRPSFRSHNPTLPAWFDQDRTDLTDRLSEIDVPVLLLWGDADPISPVAVGERLRSLLPRASLVVVHGGTHDLVAERAADIAADVDRHLGVPPPLASTT